jgi:hypothetical protein
MDPTFRKVMTAVMAVSMSAAAGAQSPARDAAKTSGTRPCIPKPPEEKPMKVSATAAAETASACLEIHAKPADIFDFLKDMLKEQGRSIGVQQRSGNTWSYVRHLEKNELEQFARTEILGGRIAWTEGKARVTVGTEDAGDGFARVNVAASFQGQGETSLPLQRPMDWWPLASKGTLEGGLIAALESHFKVTR